MTGDVNRVTVTKIDKAAALDLLDVPPLSMAAVVALRIGSSGNDQVTAFIAEERISSLQPFGPRPRLHRFARSHRPD